VTCLVGNLRGPSVKRTNWGKRKILGPIEVGGNVGHGPWKKGIKMRGEGKDLSREFTNLWVKRIKLECGRAFLLTGGTGGTGNSRGRGVILICRN